MRLAEVNSNLDMGVSVKIMTVPLKVTQCVKPILCLHRNGTAHGNSSEILRLSEQLTTALSV